MILDGTTLVLTWCIAHLQLAVLATYVGDEFLALYHCIRSLAVREPFPDAHDNLIVLLERVKSLKPKLHHGYFNLLPINKRGFGSVLYWMF